MAKFTFTTLTARSTRYRTPSGTEYVFYKDQPTRVESSEDVQYFDSNKRFQREKRNAIAKPQKGADEELYDELKSIEGIGSTTAKKIVDQFSTKQELSLHLDSGLDLQGVSNTAQLKIHKAIANREVDE